MQDQEVLEQANNENVVDNTDYISAIQELKQNSVDRTKYNSLKEENKKLIKALINGEEFGGSNPQTNEVSIEELRHNLNKEGLTNLQYVTYALDLRKALLDAGEEDPFVPQGTKYNPTPADYAKAEKVATILQEMVDDSDGNPDVFLNEYQRRVKDTTMDRKNKK